MTVDQKPIGRTPRSNLATYTGLFDEIRKRFADTKAARRRNYMLASFRSMWRKADVKLVRVKALCYVETLISSERLRPMSHL